MAFVVKQCVTVFVLGLVYFPVVSWEAEYDQMCDAADADLKAYLEKRFDPYLPDKQWAVEAVCETPTLRDGLANSPGAQEVFKWQRTNPTEVEQVCDYRKEIGYCYDDRPLWITVVSVVQGLVVLVWALLVLAVAWVVYIEEFLYLYPSETVLLIVCFGSGLAGGWYLAQWLYA